MFWHTCMHAVLGLSLAPCRGGLPCGMLAACLVCLVRTHVPSQPGYIPCVRLHACWSLCTLGLIMVVANVLSGRAVPPCVCAVDRQQELRAVHDLPQGLSPQVGNSGFQNLTRLAHTYTHLGPACALGPSAAAALDCTAADMRSFWKCMYASRCPGICV